MSEISETEIYHMTKEQNYMRGYKDGASDMTARYRLEDILRIVHGTFLPYFVKCNYDEKESFTERDLLLLRINKEVCKNIEKYWKEGGSTNG